METSLSLLERLAQAPTDADWRRLHDWYAPLLCEWLARAGVRGPDADDAIQEVLMVVVRRLREFERRRCGAFRAWLWTIVANQARRFFRQRATAIASADLDALADPGSHLSTFWAAEHDRYLASRALRAVEGDFAPTTWQAFRRQVLEGQAAPQVATELGLSLNAVLIAKCRVLKALRAVLADWIEADAG
jgi:RNA polymerase sigma-70 factor (ECF subfamily)